MTSLYRKIVTMTKETMYYLNYTERPVDDICSGKYRITKKILESVFKKDITNKNHKKYRKKLLENCKNLMELFHSEKYMKNLEDIYNYIPREFETADINLEIVLNIAVYLSSFLITWTNYLILYASGRKMITDIFTVKGTKSKLLALANIYIVLQTVWVMSQYDEVFFQKELFSMLPDIDKIVAGTVLESWIVKFVTNKCTIAVLLTAVKSFLKDNGQSIPVVRRIGKPPTNSDID